MDLLIHLPLSSVSARGAVPGLGLQRRHPPGQVPAAAQLVGARRHQPHARGKLRWIEIKPIVDNLRDVCRVCSGPLAVHPTAGRPEEDGIPVAQARRETEGKSRQEFRFSIIQYWLNYMCLPFHRRI